MPCLSALSLQMRALAKSSRFVLFSSWGSTTATNVGDGKRDQGGPHACTTPSWQPPARAICPLEAARISLPENHRWLSDRHGGLDENGDAGREIARRS